MAKQIKQTSATEEAIAQRLSYSRNLAKPPSGYAYKLNDKNDLAVDTADAEVETDGGKMCATIVFSTESVDRSRDLLITKGIRTGNHRKNPISLFNHGLTGLVLPIAKCEDPDGNYTVRLEEKRAVAGLYFSQSLREAEQIFELMQEKILRAASIGFQPVVVSQRLNDEGDDNQLQPPGTQYDEVDLCEISVVTVPDNPEAILVALGKSKLSPVIKGALLPYAPHRKVTATVPSLDGIDNMATKTAAKSTTALTTEDAIVPEETTKAADDETSEEVASHQDDGSAIETDDRPPGAKALEAHYDHLCAACEHIKEAIGRQENPAVLDHLEEHAKALEGMCSDTGKCFGKEYPELDPIHAEEDEHKDMEDDPDTDAEHEGDEGSESDIPGDEQGQEYDRGRKASDNAKIKLALKARLQKLAAKRIAQPVHFGPMAKLAAGNNRVVVETLQKELREKDALLVKIQGEHQRLMKAYKLLRNGR
jgi:hypothetical protein